MNGKLVAIYGDRGVGKTTTAANLAVQLAKDGGNTLLVSTDLTAPTLQVVFGVNVPTCAGIGRALADGVLRAAVPSGEERLSLLSVPDDALALDLDYLTTEHARTLLASAVRDYDYVVVDCESGITNPLAITAVSVADYCYTLYRADNYGRATAIAYKSLLEGLRKDKHLAYIIVDGSLSETDFEAFTGVRFSFSMPFVANMDEIRDSGKTALQTLLFRHKGAYMTFMWMLAREVSGNERENGS